MTAREAILGRVRAAVRHQALHPGAFRGRAGSGEAGTWASFARVLGDVGGEAMGPLAPAAVAGVVRDLCRRAGARRVVAGPGTELGDGPWAGVAPDVSPRSLDDVDVAILRASIGVAENAAVAVDGRQAPVRALPFLCERLVLLLDLEALVLDMHQATDRMAADATRFHHFTWISGPSKTADIEQTLVLGAHGPRSLTVLGVRSIPG